MRWKAFFPLSQIHIEAASVVRGLSGLTVSELRHTIFSDYVRFCRPLIAAMMLVNPAPKTAPHVNNPSICTVLTFSVNSITATAQNTTMRATFLMINLVFISISVLVATLSLQKSPFPCREIAGENTALRIPPSFRATPRSPPRSNADR